MPTPSSFPSQLIHTVNGDQYSNHSSPHLLHDPITLLSTFGPINTSCTNVPPHTQHQQESSSQLTPSGKHTRHANTTATHTPRLPHRSPHPKTLVSASQKHSAYTSTMVSSSEATLTFTHLPQLTIPLAHPTPLHSTPHRRCGSH
jgi:hypothetical protein